MALEEAAAWQCCRTLQGCDFTRSIDRRYLRSRGWALVGILVVSCSIVCVIPRELSDVWQQRWLGGHDQPWPRNTSIVLVGADQNRLIVPYGEEVSLEFVVRDKRRQTKTLRVEMHGSAGQRSSVMADAQGRFLHRLPALTRAAQLTIRGGDRRLGPIVVQPVGRPRLAAVEVRYRTWEDGDATRLSLYDVGRPQLLARSHAELTVIADVPIRSLHAQWNGSSPEGPERLDAKTFRFRWTHGAETRIGLRVTARDSGLESETQSFTIGLQPDRRPAVTAQLQGVTTRITPAAIVPLRIVARDDHGITAVRMRVSADEASSPFDSKEDRNHLRRAADSSLTPVQKQVVPLPREHRELPVQTMFGPDPTSNERTVQLRPELSVNEFALQPGTMLYIAIHAQDNCLTGKQSSATEELQLQVVAPAVLLREIQLRQRQLRQRFLVAIDQAVELREYLHKSRDAASDDEMDLAEVAGRREPEAPRYRPGQALSMHLAVHRTVDAVRRGFDETLQEMVWNQCSSDTATRLIRQSILRPLDKLSSGPLARQRRLLQSNFELGAESPRLQDLRDRPTETSKHPASGAASQSMAASRTVSGVVQVQLELQDAIIHEMRDIVKALALWDGLLDVVDQLDNILRLQEDVYRQTEALREDEIESVFVD